MIDFKVHYPDTIEPLRYGLVGNITADNPDYFSFCFFNYRKALALGRKRTLVRELIKLRSWPAVHLEGRFSGRYHGLSFSSTNEGGLHGCRVDRIGYTGGCWDIIKAPVTAKQEAEIWERVWEINGKKYDLIGVLSNVHERRIILPNRDMYWCNEAVGYIAKPTLYTGPLEIVPEAMRQIMLDMAAKLDGWVVELCEKGSA